MRNISTGSNNGLINRFCCLFSMDSLCNLITHITLIVIGMVFLNHYLTEENFINSKNSLISHNSQFNKALTLAAVVSIVVFLVNELKEYNEKNNYLIGFCRKLFGYKYKIDEYLKRIMFFLTLVFTVLEFILLKVAEKADGVYQFKKLILSILLVGLMITFFILEILIYYYKLNLKKITIEKSIIELTGKQYRLNTVNKQQILDLIEIVSQTDNIGTFKTMLSITIDIFSGYDYINKSEVYENLSRYVCESIIEYCNDHNIDETNKQTAFIINRLFEKDIKKDNIIIAFFIIYYSITYDIFPDINYLSNNCRKNLFYLYPFISIIYYDIFKNNTIIKENYKELLFENGFNISRSKHYKFDQLMKEVFEFKFANHEITSEAFYIFKKIEQYDLLCLYVFDYLVY